MFLSSFARAKLRACARLAVFACVVLAASACEGQSGDDDPAGPDSELRADGDAQDFARGGWFDGWGRRACVRRSRTIVDVTPASSGPVAPDTAVSYRVRVKNNDSASCEASEFTIELNGNRIERGLRWLDRRDALVAPGAIGTLEVVASGDATLEPGRYLLPFRVVRLGDQTDLPGAPASVLYEVPESSASGCAVRARRELLVRDLSVVEDPRRTSLTGNTADASLGAWTFTRLIENAAPLRAAAPLMTEALFGSFAREQTINGFTVAARNDAERFLLTPWPRTSDGKLDLTRVPLRLLAIVNRLDLRDLAAGHAGELAFVFGLFNPQDFTLGAPTRRARAVDFTLVLEYRLPARTPEDVAAWAEAWHQLGSLPFPSERYNAALEALTQRITARGAAPGLVNDSALQRVRTNDGKFEGNGNWELREFALSPETGLLAPRATRLTPDNSLMDSDRLGRFVNQHEEQILSDQYEVPETYEGEPFLAGASHNDSRVWDALSIVNPEARHRFALNTCNGCHGTETETDRKHIASRLEGELSFLSPFLTGSTVLDPVSGASRSFGELARRGADLEAIVCGADRAAAVGRRPTISGSVPPLALSRAAPDRLTILSHGISRTH